MTAEQTAEQTVEEQELPTEEVPAPVVEAVEAFESNLDRLDPQPSNVTLSFGMDVKIRPLKTRQFFKMLRIVTRGGANVLSSLNLSPDVSDEQFATQLIGLVVFSIPEAEDEAVDFIRSMVEPVDPADADRLNEELSNPEIEDTVTILEAVLRRESGDLKALGKRLSAMLRTAEKVGATKPVKGSSEGTPESSTS